MIYDSMPWKKGLLRDAAIIERWANKKPTERQSIIIEKKIFITSYVVRKLIEGHKVATNLRGRTVLRNGSGFAKSPGNLCHHNREHF
jgi:hypothetical protein